MRDLSELFSLQTGLLKHIGDKPARFLYDEINWKNRLVGIVGGRGTGKTTMLLQRLNEEKKAGKNVLYISADHIRVEALGLYEIGSSFFKTGGKILAVDEIHKYQNWAQEIKNLYDSFPESCLLFSGSSALHLQLGKSDLSRRAVYYTMSILSFREYLLFNDGYGHPACQLQDILQNHMKLAEDIRPAKAILGSFAEYLQVEAYPFFLEGREEYQAKLENVIEKVLYEDIPATEGIRFSGIPVLKKILFEIATSPPFELNIEKMSNRLGVARTTVYAYLEHLEQAGLILKVMPQGSGSRLTRKPAKLFMANTNLLRTVGGRLQPEDPIGTVRENFFISQFAGVKKYHVRAAPKGDFIVDDEYLFEVGGRAKSQHQIQEHQNGFIVKDDIETGYGNIIPLWMFGFLY